MIHLQMPELLFAKNKLYKIATNNTAAVPEAVAANSNAHTVAVYESKGELSPAESEQLQKLLAACKLNASDVVLLNADSLTLNLGSLQGIMPRLQKVLLFGKVEGFTNFVPDKNRCYDLNGLKLLNAAPLSVLLTNANEKKQLWPELKEMFGV